MLFLSGNAACGWIVSDMLKFFINKFMSISFIQYAKYQCILQIEHRDKGSLFFYSTFLLPEEPVSMIDQGKRVNESETNTIN